MKTLKPPDSHHLRAAHGWLELGNHAEANEELETIAPAKRTHSDVLEVRLLIYKKARKWVHRSFALHELKRTQEGFDRLLPVVDKFPPEWTIPYNLACYCAQLGRFEESATWFKKAILIDEKAVQRAGLMTRICSRCGTA